MPKPQRSPDERQPVQEVQRYTAKDVATYVHMSQHTLRSWIRDATFLTQPAPSASGPRLSYNDLIEIYVVHALKQEMSLTHREIERARATAAELGIERPFLSDQLRVRKGNILIEEGGDEVVLINISELGQIEIAETVEQYLKRIDFSHGFPVSFYPVTRAGHPEGPRHIVIRPDVGFGRPITAERSISAAVIKDRFNAGESVQELAEDYDLDEEYIEEAIRAFSEPLAA